MQLSTSSAPFADSVATRVGVRAPGNSGNTIKCGVSGGIMANASTTRLSVSQITSIGGNIQVVNAHVNVPPIYAPSANITFSYMMGAYPDFTAGAIQLPAWATLQASTHSI